MLLALSGKAGSGKDTVAQQIVDHFGFKRYAFADAVRDGVLALDPFVDRDFVGTPMRLSQFITQPRDWEWVKREVPEARRLLQVYGTQVGRQLLGENVWVDLVAKQWKADGKPDAVISDCRFPNEVEFVKNNGGFVIHIERPNNPHAIDSSHVSEQFVPDADYTLQNNESLVDVYFLVVNLMSEISKNGH